MFRGQEWKQEDLGIFRKPYEKRADFENEVAELGEILEKIERRNVLTVIFLYAPWCLEVCKEAHSHLKVVYDFEKADFISVNADIVSPFSFAAKASFLPDCLFFYGGFQLIGEGLMGCNEIKNGIRDRLEKIMANFFRD